MSQQFAEFSVATAQSHMTGILSKYLKIDGVWAGGGEHEDAARRSRQGMIAHRI